MLKKAKTEDGYMRWMEGKKTYSGIAIVVLGLLLSVLGVGGESEATEIVTNAMTVIGSVVAVYGRWKAKAAPAE